MGLLSGKLGPRLAGGIEKNTDLRNNWLSNHKRLDEFAILERINDGDEDEGDTDDAASYSSKESESNQPQVSNANDKLSKGQGRIVRDSNGKIVKVILGDESEIELQPTAEDSSKIIIDRKADLTVSTPWGNPLQAPSYEQHPTEFTQPASPVLQGIGYHNPRRGQVPPKTKFVEELERIASHRLASHTEAIKKKQHLSDNQTNWLRKLVDKHGIANAQAMARDLKLNRHQKTEAEIRHLLSKLPSTL